LRDDEEMKQRLADKRMKMLTYEDGIKLAKEIGGTYCECSALTSSGLFNISKTRT